MTSKKNPYMLEANQNAPWLLEGFLFSRVRHDAQVSARWKSEFSVPSFVSQCYARATRHNIYSCVLLQNNLIIRKRLENYELNRIKSHLDFHRLCLGLFQRQNQIRIIHRASFRSRQFVKNLVFNLLQFLSHFSATNNQLVLGFL